jgi:hypothetical protein
MVVIQPADSRVDHVNSSRPALILPHVGVGEGLLDHLPGGDQKVSFRSILRTHGNSFLISLEEALLNALMYLEISVLGWALNRMWM